MQYHVVVTERCTLCCTYCGGLWVCGGRCLFSNKTMFWGRR